MWERRMIRLGGLHCRSYNGLRPFLSKWHPLLLEWEEKKPNGTSPQVHEKAWDKELIVRGELDALRGDLEQYANALAEIAGVSE